VNELLARTADLVGAKNAKERADWLIDNITSLKPGISVNYRDPIKGDRKGVVTSVEMPRAKDDFFLLGNYRLKVVFPGEERPHDLSLATLRAQEEKLFNNYWFTLDKKEWDRSAMQRRQSETLLQEFDDAPDGKVLRSQLVLQGNIFRACEMAAQEGIGFPVLYTDAEGNRQRGVLLREYITPEKVKSMPVGLDHQDVHDYIKEYLRADRPDHRERLLGGNRALAVYNTAVKNMEDGDGIALKASRDGRNMILLTPGTARRAGTLMKDGAIFDLGEANAREGSLKLKLTGTRSGMRASVEMDQVGDLLRYLQSNKHVGKFYVPNPDPDILRLLKERHISAKRQGRDVQELAAASF